MPYRKSEPVYPILEAEISKRNIKKKDIADTIGIIPRSLSVKLMGKTDFTLTEAITIHHIFFHDVAIEYLFNKNGETLSCPAKNK